MMDAKGFTIINYFDNFVGIGFQSVVHALCVALLDLTAKLGLIVSEKTLVVHSTQAVCLGILIDWQKGAIPTPPEKL